VGNILYAKQRLLITEMAHSHTSMLIVRYTKHNFVKYWSWQWRLANEKRKITTRAYSYSLLVGRCVHCVRCDSYAYFLKVTCDRCFESCKPRFSARTGTANNSCVSCFRPPKQNPGLKNFYWTFQNIGSVFGRLYNRSRNCYVLCVYCRS